MIIGYARVSSEDQSLDVQLEYLANYGCEKIFSEKRSGRTAHDRVELNLALEFAREGDTLVVTRLDRLGRSVADLHKILEKLTIKGVGFKCLNQSGVDTDSSTGRLMLTILAAVASFESDIRLERQREGIAKAKAQKKYRGRKPTIDPTRVCQLRSEGHGATEIARMLNIARTSVYRLT